MIRTIFLLYFIACIRENRGECNLSLRADFGTPAPVYLRNGELLSPGADGGVSLRRAERLQVACPGTKKYVVVANQSTGADSIDIKCVRNSTFQAVGGSWVGGLREVTCTQPPWYGAEDVGACSGGNRLYRVGYRVSGELHARYSACFDRGRLHTLYVRELLSPANNYLQNGSRTGFIEGELFAKHSMNRLYKLEHQRRRFDELLGPGMGAKYVTKTQFLSRGHLAARADFPLVAEQRASFHYVNTAPQWQRGNAGDWAALEEALRRRVHSSGAPVTVYTGTWGVSTLPDARGQDTELYLDVDTNNNGVVPVPLYFYKVVHDEANRTAVAFISINSSYYNSSRVDELTFCADVCDENPQYRWLRWRPRDGTHSFCCTYQDFARKIQNLPKLDVRGLYY
ncbi:uncharacterized protein LOC121725679 [Aricia agestis]|uniref:uncharacterized protein LOC121725679 n=1 Tax=Aricia agestis TaxID=91739 RepID=UPI001C206A7F|nr:uncharacterized protein LOC121725679 [Aricia agestis]